MIKKTKFALLGGVDEFLVKAVEFSEGQDLCVFSWALKVYVV